MSAVPISVVDDIPRLEHEAGGRHHTTSDPLTVAPAHVGSRTDEFSDVLQVTRARGVLPVIVTRSTAAKTDRTAARLVEAGVLA